MPWKNDQVLESETEKIIELAKKQLEIDGDYVELGCYRGDTSLLLADLLKNTGKKLWVYDSFEGLPEKTANDESALGVDFKKGALGVTKREVKARFLRAGLPVPVIKKGWFSDLVSEDLPDAIAFSFLDGDLYESIRDSLGLVNKKMVDGGLIVVHDYSNEALPGVARAVDEWLKENNYKFERYQSMIIIKITR